MNKGFKIVVIIVVLIIILLIIWAKRYELGIIRMPREFESSIGGTWYSFRTDGKTYTKQKGLLSMITEKVEKINKSDYIKAYKEMLIWSENNRAIIVLGENNINE